MSRSQLIVGFDAGEGYFECLVDAVVCAADGGSFCRAVSKEEGRSAVNYGDGESERQAVKIREIPGRVTAKGLHQAQEYNGHSVSLHKKYIYLNSKTSTHCPRPLSIASKALLNTPTILSVSSNPTLILTSPLSTPNRAAHSNSP